MLKLLFNSPFLLVYQLLLQTLFRTGKLKSSKQKLYSEAAFHQKADTSAPHYESNHRKAKGGPWEKLLLYLPQFLAKFLIFGGGETSDKRSSQCILTSK